MKNKRRGVLEVPNKGETALEAVAGICKTGDTKMETAAGTCKDTSFIRKVEKFNEDYRLKEKGAILNWFDITAPEGYYSLNDKISAVLESEEAAKLFWEMVKPMFGDEKTAEVKNADAETGKTDAESENIDTGTEQETAGVKNTDTGTEKTAAASDNKMNAGMMQMFGGFTILRLAGMIGMAGVEWTKEELLDLNEKLNKVAKK